MHSGSFSTNDSKGKWKTKFSSNEFLTHKHATGDGQCFYNAPFLAILDRAQKRLPVPENFKKNFITKLRQVEKTDGFQQHVGTDQAGLTSDITSFDKLSPMAQIQENLQTLERIGGYVLRQMAYHQKTTVLSRLLNGAPYEHPTSEKTWGGDETDRLALEKVTGLQVETYTVTGAQEKNKLTLDEASTRNHDAHKPSIRIVHNKINTKSRENNHYDWLEVTESPLPSNDNAVTPTSLNTFIKTLPNNYYASGAIQTRTDHADQVAKQTSQLRFNQLVESEGTQRTELIKARAALQSKLTNLTKDDVVTAKDKIITAAQISGITNALSMYAMHREHQALQAAPASLHCSTGAISQTAVAEAGGPGAENGYDADKGMSAPEEQANTASIADSASLSPYTSEDEDEDIALTDNEADSPSAKRGKTSTASILEQIADCANVTPDYFQKASTLAEQTQAVRQYANGDEEKYMKAFTELSKAAGEDTNDDSFLKAIGIQRNLDVDPDYEPEGHPTCK